MEVLGGIVIGVVFLMGMVKVFINAYDLYFGGD